MIAIIVSLLPVKATFAQVDLAAPGEGSVSAKLAMYSDDDRTTVTTSIVDGQVRLPVPVTVGGHVLVDSVSSASVDVVSAATGRWTENRVEAGARATVRIAETDVTAAYVHSEENDWMSHGAQLGVARDFAQRNTRVDLAYGTSKNDVGRALDPSFLEHLDTHTIEAGVNQLWDENTQLSLRYTLQFADGYQSSPYRYVTTTSGMSLPERHPGERQRHAVTVRALRALAPSLAGDVSYRLYLDDWGITSHTIATALAWEASERWELRARVRGYYQGDATFYKEFYATPTAFMSADRELATFWDAGTGVKLSWHAHDLVVDLKVDGLYYRFLNFSRLEGRVAVVTAGGLRWDW